MSAEVTYAHVLQYTTNVRHLLQQRGSRLRAAVMEGTHTGNGAVPVEQIGAVAATVRTVRHADSPIDDVPHRRRWVFPTDYEFGAMVDKQDAVRLLIDPKSPYVEAGVNAMNRAIDDIIIAAATGTSTVGASTGGGNTTTEAYDSATYEQAAGGVGLTMTKLRIARERFINAEVDVDNDPLYCVIGASQVGDLLNETQMISVDFNDSKVLPSGMLKPMLGFNFIISNRLSLSGAERRVLCFARSGLHLGVWNDIEPNAAIRPDKGFNWYAHVRGTFGATRLEQGRVQSILCTE